MTWLERGMCAVVLAAGMMGCGFQAGGDSLRPPTAAVRTSASPTEAASTAPPAEPGATPSGLRVKLPAGFPVMPSAESARLPNDPGVVARWTVNQVGSGPYDWYVDALPAAGFEIVGTYPSERAALIRFRDATARVWQLLLELAGDQTQISVQTDRP
jgi:hypothetical protein